MLVGFGFALDGSDGEGGAERREGLKGKTLPYWGRRTGLLRCYCVEFEVRRSFAKPIDASMGVARASSVLVRSTEAQHAEYVWMNPVKAGLVERPEEYAYSSARLRNESDAAPYQFEVPRLKAILGARAVPLD
jgi:hypothetical protein